MKSVLNNWVCELPYMMQSVLICAVRNHDGFTKQNPAKDITRWLRRCILKSAFDDREMRDPFEQGGGNFTGPIQQGSLERSLVAFLNGRDEMSLHYYLHFAHAAEIIGYEHPVDTIREWWKAAYVRMASACHMFPEPKDAMRLRLSDNRETWLARSDAYEREQFAMEQAKPEEFTPEEIAHVVNGGILRLQGEFDLADEVEAALEPASPKAAAVRGAH
jgi:hypothetical protein